MRVLVTTRLPSDRLLSSRERELLRRAGITDRLLTESWRRALVAIFERVYPDDEFEVRVLHPAYGGQLLDGDIEFSVDVNAKVRASMTDQLAFSVEVAQASWLAALGTFSELIARHRTAAYS